MARGRGGREAGLKEDGGEGFAAGDWRGSEAVF